MITAVFKDEEKQLYATARFTTMRYLRIQTSFMCILNYAFLGHFICIFLFNSHFEKSLFTIPYFSNHKV